MGTAPWQQFGDPVGGLGCPVKSRLAYMWDACFDVRRSMADSFAVALSSTCSSPHWAGKHREPLCSAGELSLISSGYLIASIDRLIGALFNMSFYMTYLARWPDYFHVAEGPGNHIMGYIMGKVEGQGESWHGHVTAVTVASEYRRQQLAKKLMHLLENISDKIDKAYFVDLFVRASNMPAIKMYEKLGYVIYRRVLRYYSGEEDGLDMRKALSRDILQKSVFHCHSSGNCFGERIQPDLPFHGAVTIGSPS
ncbi:FR47-like protein [Musa troglodytarum]|uniref:FR47-like protein n=1 Tax=Musa troglodytarum TaxID=320322 RepID=A0A9E7HWT8_9LILI|nr:FR47-like protein [Musa troglodytarum]